MPLEQNVFMTNVWRQVGLKTRTDRYETSLQPSLIQAREYGLLLHWPRSLTFLNVGATYGDRKPFARGRQAFETLARELAAPSPDPMFLDGKQLLVARVQRSDPIVIGFRVDTDDPVFCLMAHEELQRGEKQVKVQIGLTVFAGRESEEGQINLFLSPADAVRTYDGYVALDVGNTASTLVCLPPGNYRAKTAALQVLDANEERSGGLKPNPDPVVSHVRIDTIENFSDNPLSVKWVVGRVASTAIDGLVAGPKRLAAASDWEDLQFFNSRQRAALPRRVPAELLVCRMLQRFREATSTHPRELALTYPTTYEPRELKQLREVVWRGFRRASWQGQSRAKDEEAVQQRVPVLLDEASAAAYFYLYQRILETPGGLPRFRYLYPEGLNLLLYDCGGGTTDIALVHAESEPGSNKLVIGVKARSGLRGFGGDNVTIAVFRLLKAKLAIEIARLKGNAAVNRAAFPEKPVASDELERLLTSGAKQFDSIVPTTFDRDVMDDVNRQRRNFALELWQRAEAVKCKLQDGTAMLGVLTSGAGKGQDSLWDKLLSDFTASPQKEQEARRRLEQIKVQRWEVDALVREPLERSIENCNNLIHEKLTDVGQEVHWVVASGNGARYPLIQELLRQRLAVQSIDDGRFYLDPDNLKHAVAKGAVLYLATLRAETQLDVEFDTVLSDCLPFDVLYRDPVTNTYSVLFREHDRYERIADEEPRKLTRLRESAGEPQNTHRIELARRWPGDGKNYSPYLLFDFEQDVEFPVEVWFDREEKAFAVRDSRGQPGKRLEQVEKTIYESPVQRGDL